MALSLKDPETDSLARQVAMRNEPGAARVLDVINGLVGASDQQMLVCAIFRIDRNADARLIAQGQK